VAEILGYETGHSMTYVTVVDRRSDLLQFTLNKWLRRTERILTGLLPEPRYVRFDRDALLESATLARYEAHAKALQNRWKTVNEVRADEDMASVPWGDEPNEMGSRSKAGDDDGVTAGI
jgi:phage portal protein BeeE